MIEISVTVAMVYIFNSQNVASSIPRGLPWPQSPWSILGFQNFRVISKDRVLRNIPLSFSYRQYWGLLPSAFYHSMPSFAPNEQVSVFVKSFGYAWLCLPA